MDLIKTIEEKQKKEAAENFNVGDTVRVFFKIIEGKTERVQVYEGLVICKKNSGIGRTFTVRKNSYGVGVERVFPENPGLWGSLRLAASLPSVAGHCSTCVAQDIRGMMT